MPILKTIGSLLGPFLADLRESLSVYPKSGKNSLNFSTVLVPSIIILQFFFSYQNKDLGLFYLMNFYVLQKKKNVGCTGCRIFLVILEWPNFGLNSKKHPTSDFHENWSIYRKKSNFKFMFSGHFYFFSFCGPKT